MQEKNNFHKKQLHGGWFVFLLCRGKYFSLLFIPKSEGRGIEFKPSLRRISEIINWKKSCDVSKQKVKKIYICF